MNAVAYTAFAINTLVWGVLTIFAVHFFDGVGPYEKLSIFFILVMTAGPPLMLLGVLSTFVFLRKNMAKFFPANCWLLIASLIGGFCYFAQYTVGV